MAKIFYEELEFSNAYIYKHCRVPLANQGLVLIRGLNLDDGGYLGAGKSSLFEVFSHAQFGKGGKHDSTRGFNQRGVSLLNRFVGSDFSSTLRLRVDGKPYEIRNYYKHQRYKNSTRVIDLNTGSDILPRDAHRAPHRWIQDNILHIDEHSFFNLIYLAQELNNVMVHGADADRRSRLTEMFDLDVYDQLLALAKKELALRTTSASDVEALKTELTNVRQQLSELPRLDDLEVDLDAAKISLAAAHTAFQADTEQYTQLIELCAGVQQRAKLKSLVITKFTDSALSKLYANPGEVSVEDVDEWRRNYTNTHAAFAAAQADLNRLAKRHILEAQLNKLIGRDLSEIQTDLAEVKAQLTRLTKVELPQAEERNALLLNLRKYDEPAESLETLEAEFTSQSVQEGRLNTRISALSTQLENAVCPQCHRPFKMDTALLKQLQVELEQLRTDLQVVTKRLHFLRDAVKRAKFFQQVRAKLEAFETVRSPEEVMRDIKDLTSRERRLVEELEISEQRVRLESELKNMPRESKDTLEDRCAKLKRDIEQLQDRVDTGSFILEKLKEMRSLPNGNIKQLRAQAAELKQRITDASAVLSDLNRSVATLEQQVNESRRLRRRKRTLEEVVEQKSQLLLELQCFASLVKAFGSQGLKQDRFQSILTDATQRTVPVYSNILWPNRNIDISLSDREGSIQFQLNRSGVSTNSGLLSGGERHKAGLAFLFGMRDLKEIYTGSAANVLIVDEPFGNLDPLGTEGLIYVLNLLKQKFGSVFVISHRPEVLAHQVWDQTWWAIRENNTATLYTSEPPIKYLRIAADLVKQ